MGFGTVEKLEKQAEFRKKNGKSKAKLVMKTSKKQPKNVCKITTASDKKKG